MWGYSSRSLNIVLSWSTFVLCSRKYFDQGYGADMISVLFYTKEHYSIHIVRGVTVLGLCILSDHVLD